MSKYGVFSGPYFPVFGLNLKIYEMPTRKNSVFGYFSRSELTLCVSKFYLIFAKQFLFLFLLFISNLTLKFGFNSTWNLTFSWTYEKLWRYEKYTRKCRKNCRTSLQKVPSRVRQSEKEFPNSGRREVSRRNLN